MQSAYEIRTYRLKKGFSNMAKKLYDAVIPTGEYVDKNGNNKTRWEVIGSVLELDGGKKGLLLKRTFAPSGMPLMTKHLTTFSSICLSLNVITEAIQHGSFSFWSFNL